MNKKLIAGLTVAGLAALTASASHVNQTLQLSAGWNGVSGRGVLI